MDFIALEAAMPSNYLLLSIVFLSPIIALLLFNHRRKSGGLELELELELPPGPRGWPIVGNLLNMYGQTPDIALAKLAESFGPLISLRLGSRLVVVASDPAVAKEIYRIHDRELSGRFKPIINSNIPQLDNSTIAMQAECDERWRYLRGMSHSEMFSSQAIESNSKLRFEKVIQMVEFLNRKDGQVLKIVDIVFATFGNMISKIMASHDVVGSWEKGGELKDLSKKLVQSGFPGIGDLYPALAILDHFSIKKKVGRYEEMVKSLWSDVISKRRIMLQDKGDRKSDFLDVLIQLSWDDAQIYNLFTEFLISTETLSATVEWAMVELLRNQEALSKLRNELEEATNKGEGGCFAEVDLSKLPYLQDCIKETLRLHPPNPFLVPRAALQTCKVMSYDIPKDCLIVINAYALGRDPKTWEDPLTFKPERFQGKKVDLKGTNYGLLPFGGGRRVCVGYPLAINHIQLVLASLVHAFDWSLPDGNDPSTLDMSQEFGVPLWKKHSLQLILKNRNDMNIA